MDSYILVFNEIGAEDLAKVGGKGANLGEMTRAGFRVPPGFCVTTVAFDRFMQQADEDVYARLADISGTDVKQASLIGAEVRTRLAELALPDDVARAAVTAWRAVGEAQAYAVRSSATAEDLPSASFAGQQDTYLNVRGEDELLAHIKACFISLFTDRAILYRIQNGFDHRQVKLSVVVQQMISSEVSGTLFTADPVSGHRKMVSIDASFGLGEALVSGMVTPDVYKVDKRNWQMVECAVSEKELAIWPRPEGGTKTEQLSGDKRTQQALTDNQIVELAKVATDIERHYGSPQDIEWSLVEGVFYIVQSRPITSLYPIDGLESPDDSLHIYLSMGHQQSMLDAMTPFSISAVRVLIPIGHTDSQFENKYVRASGGRFFADLTKPLRHPIFRRGILAMLGQLDALAPQAAKQVMALPEFQGPHGLHPNFSVIKGVLPIMRRVAGTVVKRDLTGFVERTNALMEEYITNARAELQGHEPGKHQLEAVIDTMSKAFSFFLHWVPETAAGIVCTRILPRLAEPWLDADELEALTLGIEGNVVNEMNLAIGDLADVARQSPQLAAAFQQLGEDGNEWLRQAEELEGSEMFLTAWEAFIQAYGSRGPSEIDIGKLRWYEQPLPVLKVIAEYLTSEPGRYRKHHEALVVGREAAIAKLRRAAGKGLMGKPRLWAINRLYHVMTEAGGMREHHKFMVIRLLAIIKEILKDTAAQLAAKNVLTQIDDIWFLTWAELFDLFDEVPEDLEERIAQRRADLEHFNKLTPNMIVTSDGQGPVAEYDIENAPEGALLGNPVSTGIVEGVAHVIRDPQTESLAPDEILVAEFTDPGWTPLFINASGLVLEVGGALTHGAVVAREYGMPAVVGVRGATQHIQTGQRIRVNGDAGYIEILE